MCFMQIQRTRGDISHPTMTHPMEPGQGTKKSSARHWKTLKIRVQEHNQWPCVPRILRHLASFHWPIQTAVPLQARPVPVPPGVQTQPWIVCWLQPITIVIDNLKEFSEVQHSGHAQLPLFYCKGLRSAVAIIVSCCRGSGPVEPFQRDASFLCSAGTSGVWVR
jgi:hypothetical protein